MVTSSPISIDQFKSPLRVTARRLVKSRIRLRATAKKRSELIKTLRQENVSLVQRESHLIERLAQANDQVQQLKVESSRLQDQPVRLPSDPKLPHHCFGPKMISMCIEIACAVGFRPAEKVLEIVFDTFGILDKTPQWTTIRTWLCRFGIATLQEPVEKADDWILMADHSNQIGTEKILVILGIRASQLPPLGQPLRHCDVRVLAVIPGTQWQQEDVAREYEAVAERVGPPIALVTDGAIELRESAFALENAGQSVLVIRDFKHMSANFLKHQLDQDERFAKFLSKIGQTRNAIQQTELAHLAPPAQKPKARFMNLGNTLHWAEVVLWQLSNPNSDGRQGITAARMNAKLGWLRSFREDVARWSRCQGVIDRSLTVINEDGLYSGASETLKSSLSFMGGCEASNQMIDKLVNFVSESEEQLSEGLRVPMSTEILESSFGLLKALEKQHSKGGFTSLIAAIPGLLRRCTPELVKESFSRVSVTSMRAWVSDQLGPTLASKRQQAYCEFRASI